MLNAGLFNIPKKKNNMYIFHQIMLSYNVQQNFIHINIKNYIGLEWIPIPSSPLYINSSHINNCINQMTILKLVQNLF
jgi:hypothetical protein